MSVALTLHEAPALRLAANRRPLWQQLHAVADAVRPSMQTLWQTALMDFRQRLSRRQLTTALQSHALLALEALWRRQWDQHVSQPVRTLLPVLVTQAVTGGAEATLPTLQRLADDPMLTFVPSSVDRASVVQWYVGQQERLIWQTTLLALREGVRWSVEQHLSQTAQGHWIHTIAGLTLRQVITLEHLLVPPQPPVTTMAVAARRIPVELAVQALRGVTMRAQQISQVQSLHSTNLGSYEAVHQATTSGRLASDEVRRFWRVTPDERLCQRCLNIAQTHPLGVTVAGAFQTYAGPILFPPAHVKCRCVVILRHVSPR